MSSTWPSTGNVVNASSAELPAAPANADDNATCKPTTDPHQPSASDRTSWRTTATTARASTSPPRAARASSTCRSGTAAARPGSRTPADGYNAWQDFSTTSNWALEIPCFTITGGRLPGRPVLLDDPGHVDGDAARVGGAGADRQRQAEPARTTRTRLVKQLTRTASTAKGNTTPGLSATDLSGGDSAGGTCTTGYCHLGGPAIPDKEAYGAGIVNAATAVKR